MNETYLIIPSLNPDEKLGNTVNALVNRGFEHIIVVDDGSDEQYKKYFPDSCDKIIRLTHEHNKGKGAAMKTAFKYITDNCPDAKVIVTVDADGQHMPSDVENCANAVEPENSVAVLGCRNFDGEDVPKRSRMGNHFTSAVFKLLCGITLSDTQTGLRAFPRKLLPLLLSISGERYEYETNMLLKFKQNGVKLKEVPIETVYIEENASSHFRPIRDSLRIYRFIISFLLSSVISCVADIALFHLIKLILPESVKATVLIATVIARVFSSLINFKINKDKVFDCKNGKKTLVKYYMLAIPQMLVSAFLVTFISFILGIPEKSALTTLIKAIVDTVLFFISYRIQQTFVFSEKGEKNDK